MHESIMEEEEMTRQQRMKIMKDMAMKIRSKERRRDAEKISKSEPDDQECGR